MALWRCPHCGTPQAETARCWVCHRSSTACGSCRHFRRSIAAQLGYCGLDRRRAALRGNEIRACWEAGPAVTGDEVASAATAPAAALGTRRDPDDRTAVRRLEFIPVEPTPAESADRARPARQAPAARHAPAPGHVEPNPSPLGQPPDARWSLWGDLEG